jgi:hypothetical protein
MAAPKDTSPDAWARQIESIRALTPQDRLRLLATMSDEVREIARDGIRHRHPDWTATEIETALAELLLGTALASAARTGPAAIAG